MRRREKVSGGRVGQKKTADAVALARLLLLLLLILCKRSCYKGGKNLEQNTSQPV